MFGRNISRIKQEHNTSGAPTFTPGFSGTRVAQSLVFCVVFCRSLLVLYLLAIVLSVLLPFAAWYLQTVVIDNKYNLIGLNRITEKIIVM